MTTNLFSSYRQGENRVTATFMAVLQRLSLPNIDRILGALLNKPNFALVAFADQPQGKVSTPDARIGTGATIWVETKTTTGVVDCKQIEAHLQSVGDGQTLLLLTPDDYPPDCGKTFGDKVVWANFRTLAEVVEKILSDADAPPSEREAFLLREFISMLRQDGLLVTGENRVMVRAARMAWPIYQQLAVYTCWPHTNFRDSAHMAFYTNNAIQALVPKVMEVIPSIVMAESGANQRSAGSPANVG